MKRQIAVLAPLVLALAMLFGCAPRRPPFELYTARIAYDRARNGPAARSNRAGVMDAWLALDAAEARYGQVSFDEMRTLGYVAERQAEIAEADGRAAVAWAQQQHAEKILLQRQAAQAQREAEMARQAAARSERRAKVGLGRLGLAAKEEGRGTVVTVPGASMFATNRSEILPSAKGRLTEIANGIADLLAEKAPEDRGRRIVIIGHTDSTGSEEHNMDLSKRRADALRAFFAEHRLGAATIETEGRGEADPIADNATPQGRAENRRVDVVVTPAGDAATK